jgi:hypothetical protein
LSKDPFEIIFDVSPKFKEMCIQEVIYNNPHLLNSSLKSNYGEIYFINVYADIDRLFEGAKKKGSKESVISIIKEVRKNEVEFNKKLEAAGFPSATNEDLIISDIFPLLKDDIVDKNFIDILSFENIITEVNIGIWLYVDEIIIASDTIPKSVTQENLEKFIEKMIEWYIIGSGDVRFYLGKPSRNSNFIRGDIKIRYIEWRKDETVREFERWFDGYIDDLKPYLIDKPNNWKESVDYLLEYCLLCGEQIDLVQPSFVCEKCFIEKERGYEKKEN